MKEVHFNDLYLNIARARIVLSLIAIVSIYVDPTTAGGFLSLDRAVIIALALHLTYSLAFYVVVARGIAVESQAIAATVLDLTFATAITFLTEGPTSPAYVFFVFAIVAVGIRGGFRATINVTLYAVALYAMAITFSWRDVARVYLMRASYLAIAGYLIGFLSQQRDKFEELAIALETRAERHTIARSLHDGYIQALAGVNLRLQTCREMLMRGESERALAGLSELQLGVTREYDQVRAYIRTLAGIDPSTANGTSVVARANRSGARPTFSISAQFSAGSTDTEHILQIMIEGMRNVGRHSGARAAEIEVSETAGSIRITIKDDGEGFERDDPPWAIASRVAEIGGHLRIADADPSGGHLEVVMPRA